MSVSTLLPLFFVFLGLFLVVAPKSVIDKVFPTSSSKLPVPHANRFLGIIALMLGGLMLFVEYTRLRPLTGDSVGTRILNENIVSAAITEDPSIHILSGRRITNKLEFGTDAVFVNATYYTKSGPGELLTVKWSDIAGRTYHEYSQVQVFGQNVFTLVPADNLGFAPGIHQVTVSDSKGSTLCVFRFSARTRA
jgi:hypothetical protein